MSKILNGGLDQYGAEPFEQQQFGTTVIKGVKTRTNTDCLWTRVVERMRQLQDAHACTQVYGNSVRARQITAETSHAVAVSITLPFRRL